MPIPLPNKPRAKAIRGHERKTHDERDAQHPRMADARRQHGIESPDVADTIDWLALFVLSLAVSAMFMAALVFFNEGDVFGAAAILAGTAGINAVALFVTKSPVVRD